MNLSPLPVQKFFDNNGAPLAGGLLFTYVAGTTTKIATYTDSTGGTSNTNPIVLNFRGECTVWMDPSLTYKLVLAPSTDTDPPSNAIWTADNIRPGVDYSTLTQNFIGQILYPKTAGETAALVTPINFFYPPGYVDRYGTNTTPGTTDMVAAFNSAFAVAKQGRCGVQWGATAPYRLNGPVNCTQMRGVVAYDSSSKNLSTGTDPSVIVAHTGHGFDLSASTEMSFNDVVAINLSGTVPKSLFFMARNAAGSGAGIHRFNNCRTVYGARFTSVIYNYGSEENCYNDCSFYNFEPSSVICNHTATNTSGYSSSFLTIATGAQSNVTHRYRGCTFYQFGNSGGTNEVVIQIEGASDFSFVDGAFYCPHGVAYVRWVGTLPCADIAFSNVRGETDGSGFSTQGYLVATTTTTGVNSHNNWTFINCRANAANQFLFLNDAAQIINLTLTNCASASGLLLSVYLITYSLINHGTSIVSGRAGGTVSNCTFIGARSNVSLSGTISSNTFIDQERGEMGANGYRFPSTQVPSSDVNTLDDYKEGTFTPAITLGGGSVTAYTTQTGTYTKVGRLVTVMLFVQVNTVSLPSGSLKISGLPFTSSSGTKGAVTVYANTIGAVATPIMGLVDPAATTLSLFKLSAGSLANMGGDVGAGTQIGITTSYEV